MHNKSIGNEGIEEMDEDGRPEEEGMRMEAEERPDDEERVRLEEERAYGQFTMTFFDDIPKEDANDNLNRMRRRRNPHAHQWEEAEEHART